MTTIVTRNGKGSPLTSTELDANFTNLNTDKADKSQVLTDVPAGALFTDTNTVYTHPTTHPASMLTGALPAIDGSALTGVTPTKLTVDALGINATHISGFTVGKSVPANAVFTDTDTNTVYTHPSTHSIAEVSGLQTALNAKVDDGQVLTNVPSGALFTDTNTWRGISNSTSSTSTSNSASSAAVKAAYDRSWPNTTYSVGDGGLTQINFTSADHTKLNGIAASANNYSLPASVVHDTESGALHSTDALRISGHTISLYKGDGTSESVVVPDNNTDTNTWRPIDNTPVNGVTTESISSNWAYDHAASSTAHPRDTRNQIAGTYNNYVLPASVIHQTELSSSVSSTSTTIAANLAGVKAAYDRSWPNTTYSVGDGGLTTKNFTSALKTKLDGVETGATADQTAAQLLTKIKTVDGSGSGLDADLLDGKDHTNFGATLATYGTTAGASGRIRCTAPFNTNSGHMFQVTVSIYSSYGIHNYVVGAYMYSSSNQWYSPTAVYSGTGTPDIKVGRDSGGKAYISIANGSYTGVRVHNMTRGYYTNASDIYDPWTITIDGATENSVTPAISKTWHSTNDGSGSGLDADLLDGQQGSYYYPASNPNGYTNNVGDITGVIGGTGLTGGGYSGTPTLNVIGGSGITANANDIAVDSTVLRTTGAQTKTGKLTLSGGLDGQAIFLSGAQNFDALKQIGFYSLYNATASGHTNAPFQYGAMISSNSNAGGGMGMQFAHERTGAGTYIRGMNDSGDTWYPWREVWTSGTDGSGSGLDADLLDGQQGSSYLLKSGGAMTGNITRHNTSSSSWPYNFKTSAVGNDNDSGFWVGSAGYPDMRLRKDSGTVSALISSWETSFVPNGFSVTGGNLTINNGNVALGTSSRGLQTATSWIRNTTQYGHIEFGPANTTWAHIYTDRPAFYMNKDIYVLNQKLYHSGNDGSGSGLDADTVDGVHESSFVRNDQGHQIIVGDHGSARLQIRRHDSSNQAERAYLSMWASEPGVTHDGAGIGGNIANNGFYYGVENTANKGALIRWHDGNTEFKYLPAVAGAGNAGTRTFYIDTSGNATASGNLTAYSDERLKDNIETITSPLDKVKALRGVTFDKDGECGLGVIAQETEAVIPEVVMTADDEMGTKSVAYGNMVGLLIEAIKEQQTQIDDLKLKLEGLS